METISGEAIRRSNAISLCKIRPPSNYLRTWKQGRSLEKLNEIEDEDAKIDSDVPVEVLNQVVSNYVIMKNVLRWLCWQDLKLCSMVNKLWRDVAANIQKDRRAAQDFFIIDTRGLLTSDWALVEAEPLLVLTFFNRASQIGNFSCDLFDNSICSLPNPNGHNHKILDYVNTTFCFPSNSMIGIYSLSTVFLSSYEVLDEAQKNLIDGRTQRQLTEQQSVHPYRTSKHRESWMEDAFAFLGGLVIPKITDLAVFKFKASSATIRNVQQTVKAFEKISKVMETNIVKCVFVFVTGIWATKGGRFIDKYIQSMRELQPDEPFALGGCAVNTVVEYNYHSDIAKSRFEVNFVVLAMPKGSSNPENFNAYSVLMEDTSNRSSRYNTKLEQFSSSITKRRHGAGIKLSCTNRRDLHHAESVGWKRLFPAACLVGCYGMGEIGADCFPADGTPEQKRLKTEEEDSVIYSYSTVLIYLTWGDKVD